MEKRSALWSHGIDLILFIGGIHLGMHFPDIDQSVAFLLHRSLLTHGLLLPLLLFLALRKDSLPGLRLFAIGFCLSLTVHLCFDLFPRKWWGFALIWIPLYGRSGATFSWMWIGLSGLVCLYIGVLLIKRALEILLSVVGLVTTFVLNCAGERHIRDAFFVLFIMTVIAFALPSRAQALLRAMSVKGE